MSMVLSIVYSNICGRKFGKPERISAHRQQHVREPVQRLDEATHVTHCCSSTRHKNVESCCLHRWRISRESRSVRHWSGNRRFWRREDQNQEVDRTSGQQRCRVCCSSRSAAIGFRPWRQNTPCVFRFRSRGQADERGIQLSQFATLFSALDLPKIGPLARVLHFAYSSRKQR